MGKTTQSKHIIRLKETRMILQIQQDPTFHDKLLRCLKDKNHHINSLCTTQAIKRIQLFLKQQLKKQIALLEKYFNQQQQEESIKINQKQQCDQRLSKLLQIMQYFYKNDDFYKQQDSNLDLFNKIMSLSDNFVVITNLVSLLLNSSFQKIQKTFFYNIYFLCNHIDLYHLQHSSIKQVYGLGQQKKDFRLYFILDNQQKQIVIQDFYQFVWENKLVGKHYRQVSKIILEKFNIKLESDSMTYHALLFKVKLYLKAVKFQQNGTVKNEANSLIQAIAYGNAMYCYIQFFVLNQQLVQSLNIPYIFTFPPDYSDIFKQLLQIFLLQKSDKNAHLIIMRSINQILEIQQKSNSIDIVSRLNDNNSLIYKYLSHAENYLTNEGYSILTSQKINIDAASQNQFILELFKIMATQVQQTHQLNNIAGSIVQSIFKKQTVCKYNSEVINQAGNLLVAIQYEQQKLMKIILQKMETDAYQIKPYLRVLNDLFSKKYHRLIQRRDLAYLARQSSQSCILVKIQPLIKEQIQKGSVKRDSFLMQTIQIIGNICQQSPTLLQNIQKTNPNIIQTLLQIIEKANHIPGDMTSISDVINFIHHVSLIDGPIRNTKMKRPLISFISRLLTMDKFSQQLIKNAKNFSQLVGTINRFITNIKSAGKYIFNGFINAALRIDDEYLKHSLSDKLITSQQIILTQFQNYNVQIQSQTIIHILKCDSKLINLLRIIDKTSQIISKKFNSRSLYMLLRPLLRIAIQRDNVFLDCALQHGLLKLVISDIVKAINNYNENMRDKEDMEKLESFHIVPLSQNLRVAGNQILIQNGEQNNNQNIQQPIQNNNQNAIVEQNPLNRLQPNQQNGQHPILQVRIQAPQVLPEQQMDNELMNLLFERSRNAVQNQDGNISDYEEIQQQAIKQKNQNQIYALNKKSIIMQPEVIQKQRSQKQDHYLQLKSFFKTLTWKMTQQQLQKQQKLSQQLIQQFYRCYEVLDKLILPLFQTSSKQTKNIQIKQAKQRLLRHLCEKNLIQTIESQFINAYINKQQNKKYTFNLVNLTINTYASKLQRLFKYLTFTLDFCNQQLNLPEYEAILQNFNRYLVFFLQLVAESNSKNIIKFMENPEIKYLETSKMPISRVQTKSLDLDNIRKNLQVELNDKWNIYNVLFDSYLRLISGSLSNMNDFFFMIKPQGIRHFQFLIRTVLKKIQNYVSQTILPALYRQDISVKQFQQFRQSIKVIMQIFVLNDLRGIQKIKTQSNLLIMFYAYSVDFNQQNIISILGKLAVQQQRFNNEEQQFYQDNAQNRWKYIKKVFLKMTFYKIKYFLSQSYLEDIQQNQIDQNKISNKDYPKQMKKNYYLFSKIHSMLCVFIENTFFAKNKNGYIRDLILFNASLFGNFCNRILTKKETIYYNHVFIDDQSKMMDDSQFYQQINIRNQKILVTLANNLQTSSLIYMPMILKAIFDLQKPSQSSVLTRFNENMKNLFEHTSSKINQIYYTLSGKHLCLGFAVPRKKSISLLSSVKSNQSISQQMIQQIEQEPQIDLKLQVLKLNNLLSMIIQFIKYFKGNKCFEQGYVKITGNYTRSMVQFGSFLLSNFEAEQHFPQEGDVLVITLVRLIEQFILYKQEKKKFNKIKKNMKKRQKHLQKRKKYKRRKAKQNDKESVSNSSQISQVSQNLQSKSSSRLSKKQQKNNKNQKKNLFKQPRKRSHPTILQKQATKSKKNRSKQILQTNLLHQAQPKGSILNRVVTDFLKISLTVSHERPFLYSRTAQLIINFLQKYSKDVVLRTQAQIMSLKSGNIDKSIQDKFFVYGAQLFGDLLKIKVKNQKAEGFFYLISYLAMKMMTQVHAKIDFQCAIKRFFYEQQMKIQNSNLSKQKYRIKLSQFQASLMQESLIDFPDMSYLLNFVQIKKKSQDGISRKKFEKKNQQEEIIHEFNRKNFKNFQTFPDDSMYIKLKNPSQVDLISLPSLKRRKSSHFQQENKKVRFYQYHPEGDFAALICQIISHIIKIIIKQIIQNCQNKDQNQQKQSLPVFTLKTLLYTLQVLCRQSPTIVPWIARFKCKKILLNEFKLYNLNNESQAYKRIFKYIYGTQSILVQNLQEISFLSLLIKFVYPISQISTFLFELCLDNNVVMHDKSQNKRQVKQGQQNSLETKKFVPFGSIIRQKVLQQIQNQLLSNKIIDQNFIKNNYNITQSNCLIIKKVSCIGLLTILLSIKQLAKLCIQNNLLKKLQQQYLRTNNIIKHYCNPKSNTGVGLSSSITRNFMLNFFIKPMEILQQLTVQYHIWKKQPNLKSKEAINFSNNRVYIKYLLNGDTINDQLFSNDIFFKTKFRTEWFYVNGLQGDEPLEFQDGIDHVSRSSGYNDNNFYDMFDDDSASQNGALLDQQIQQQDLNNGSIQISGQQLLNQQQQQGSIEDQSGNMDQNGSHDPFQRDSNTFQNFVLYPQDDHVIQSEIEDESIDQDLDIDIEDDSQSLSDIDENQIDEYDDDQEDSNDIDISPRENNVLFPINEDSASQGMLTWPFGEGFSRRNTEPTRIVPAVGIYYYFMPPEPDRREHPNHVCNHSSKPETKQLQNLYEIFMDVVSFEHIVITNNMVKLQNQQAKMIRKVFKVLAYKKLKGKVSLYKQNILKLEQQYYDQIYQIFSFDQMLAACEAVDFKHCDKMSHFLQTIPTHFIDQYMDEPDIYFNQITKPLRARRRGLFVNPQIIERVRRDRNVLQSLHQGPRIRRGGRIIPNNHIFRSNQQSQSSRSINDENAQQNPIAAQQQGNQEQQDNQVMNRIQFNIQNPNGGVINFHASLDQILLNMGMTERQFLNLPQEVQSDIIQNSLSNQLLQQNGNLNQIVGRLDRGVEAPNVSPILQPHHQQMEQEHIGHQARQDNINQPEDEIQMPESFDMDEQQNVLQNQNGIHASEPPQQIQRSQQQRNLRNRSNRINQGSQSQSSSESSESPIEQINQQQSFPEQQQALPQRYRKISLSHSQKISKDIIQMLNKDSKNDSKFPQISQELLQQIVQIIFNLQNKDFARFPYSLISMNMINSKNCSKILSTIMTLLDLYPNDDKMNGMIEDRKYGKQLISLKKDQNDCIPKLGLRSYLYQISNDYQNQIYPNISVKLLHMLESLTKSYSISMQMLKFNNSPLKSLQKYISCQSKQQNYLSSFQKLFRLLGADSINRSPVLVQQILRITNNIVTHYFEKNIFSIHQQQKQLKKKNQERLETQLQQDNDRMEQEKPQQVSILPICLQQSRQKQKQQQSLSPIVSHTHKAIQLQQKSVQLICSLLMADDLRESQHLSQLIMKLSINGKNLLLFIKNIESVLQKLCQKSIAFLSKQKKQSTQQQSMKYPIQVEETELDDLIKVYCLLEIFSSMIKEFKQFAYRHHVDRYDFIMGKFKDIIESKALFRLCEAIAGIISKSGQRNDLIKNIPEIFQIFFIVFSINMEISAKNGQEDRSIVQERQANKIASLGQINEKHKNQSSKKIQTSIVTPGNYLIQNMAFNKLWNDKVCSANGRILLNSTIKRKLSTILKRKNQLKNTSLFDIPMIKIVINSPHLLDFENKRALFRAQMKRVKKRTSVDKTIYMSLDRKEVFQQSFGIIMHKKPQDLKNRVKIDFEGQQGEDAGGLTRQWYQLLSTQMFNPNYGLFRPSSTGNTYQPSSTSYVNSQHLNYFKFIGRIMGKALFDGYMLDAYFTPAFYKHILKIPITYDDMQQQDYQYFNSLKWILSNSPIQEYMDLDFTYQFDNFGELKTKQLIPNGQKVKVTQQNKLRYVQLICYAKMATAVQAQLEKFLEGLHQLVPHKYLKIFDPKELQMMISGLPTIDIVDLKRNTELTNYTKTDKIVIWLFQVLESFDMSLRTSFLQFVTGTSRVPPEGFKGLNGYNGPQKFTIQKQFDVKKLPRAHTCFNTLDLPPYPSKEILIQKLTYAITQGKEGFGMV